MTARHLTTSTQNAYPGRTALRTAAQSFLSTVTVLGVVVPTVAAIVDDELGDWIPEAWIVWFLSASGVVAALTATMARIMAIPAVDAWLRSIGLSSSPAPRAADRSTPPRTPGS